MRRRRWRCAVGSRRALHAMTAMLPTVGKGEHEPGDTASNALAPAWPSMCARAPDADHDAGGFCYSRQPAIATSLFQPRLPLCALSLCCALTDLRPPRLSAQWDRLCNCIADRSSVSRQGAGNCPSLDLMDQRQLRLLVPRRLQLTICAEGSPFPSLSTRHPPSPQLCPPPPSPPPSPPPCASPPPSPPPPPSPLPCCPHRHCRCRH